LMARREDAEPQLLERQVFSMRVGQYVECDD